jgi:hypothetical protein
VIDELVGWLRLQLDEDERVARAATSGPWWDSPVMAAPGHHTIRGGPEAVTDETSSTLNSQSDGS